MDLNTLNSYGISSKKDILEEISDDATKEFQNDNTMKKMRGDWQIIEFTTAEVAGKDSYILSGEAVEILQQTLDDHIIKTQTMKGSPFAKFMYDEIVDWEVMLMRT